MHNFINLEINLLDVENQAYSILVPICPLKQVFFFQFLDYSTIVYVFFSNFYQVSKYIYSHYYIGNALNKCSNNRIYYNIFVYLF